MHSENLIYSILHRLLIEASYKKSAGIVVVKKKKSDFLYLALVKANGKYDITKGKIEDGEDDLECARREAKEEQQKHQKFCQTQLQVN